MIEYITLSDLVKKVSQDAVEKGKEIFNTKKIREKYLNIFEIIEKKFAICAARRPLVRLPAATRRSPTATFIKVFR